MLALVNDVLHHRCLYKGLVVGAVLQPVACLGRRAELVLLNACDRALG